jgi:sugar lactone lactonase YvrE
MDLRGRADFLGVERFDKREIVRQSRRTFVRLVAAFALLSAAFGATGSPAHPAAAEPLLRPELPSVPAAGTSLWRAGYNGPASSADQAAAIASSPDGTRVFVTGQSYGSSANADFATVAFAASTGTRLWSARYAGSAGGNDAPIAAGVSPDGSKVFVTGKSWGGEAGKDDYVTVAYAASSGAKLWAKRYNDGALDDPYALAVSPDGSKVFVTGWSQGPALNWDYGTIAYSATDGGILWKRRFDGGFVDYATGLGVSPDGSKVYVGGTRYGGPANDTMDYQTFAYNASTGATAWSSRYNGGWDDYASTLGAGPDGAVFVTGASFDGSTFFNKTVAYGASGAKLWVERNGSTDYHDITIPAVRVSPTGGQVVTVGCTFDLTHAHDYATYAYRASTGRMVWSRKYSSPGYSGDLPAAVGFAPDGSRVYVTGMAASGPDTFAYDNGTGSVVWSKRVGFTPIGMAVSPDGSKLFIGGTVIGAATGADFAIVTLAA